MLPLPFTLKVAGHDAIDGFDIVSVSVKVDGIAYWADGMLTLEWAETQHVDEVSLSAVKSDVRSQPPLAIDIPIEVLTRARLLGGWWRPRIELEARYIETFANIPGAKPGRLALFIKRRDRSLAADIIAELEAAQSRVEIADPQTTMGVDGHDTNPRSLP